MLSIQNDPAQVITKIEHIVARLSRKGKKPLDIRCVRVAEFIILDVTLVGAVVSTYDLEIAYRHLAGQKPKSGSLVSD